MANKLKKVMKPILKQKCSEAYQVGYQKGVENGWKLKCRACDNQIEYLKTMLDAFRSKDMVEVVRCKDCKHYDNTEGIQWCSLNSKFAKWGTDWHSFPEDGFCSYGERRTYE